MGYVGTDCRIAPHLPKNCVFYIVVPRMERQHINSSSCGVCFITSSQTGETALHLASDRGHVKIVSLLLETGADPNIGDKVSEHYDYHEQKMASGTFFP